MVTVRRKEFSGMKRIIITIITGLVAPSLYAQDKERISEKPILCRGNYQTEHEAIGQLVQSEGEPSD